MNLSMIFVDELYLPQKFRYLSYSTYQHCCLLIFFLQNLFFYKKSLRNSIRVSKSLDPDQYRHPVGPDLAPNCLQRLSADAGL